MIMNNAFS